MDDYRLEIFVLVPLSRLLTHSFFPGILLRFHLPPFIVQLQHTVEPSSYIFYQASYANFSASLVFLLFHSFAPIYDFANWLVGFYVLMDGSVTVASNKLSQNRNRQWRNTISKRMNKQSVYSKHVNSLVKMETKYDKLQEALVNLKSLSFLFIFAFINMITGSIIFIRVVSHFVVGAQREEYGRWMRALFIVCLEEILYGDIDYH